MNLKTGLIISSNGYILSNCINKENDICYVTVNGGQIYPGKTIYEDKNLDISLIKIFSNNLVVPKIANSKNIEIGENVYFFKNYMGLNLDEEVIETHISTLKKTIKYEIEDEEYLYANGIFKLKDSLNNGIIINTNGEVLGIYSEKINGVISIDRFNNLITRLANDKNIENISLGICGFDNRELRYIKNEYDNTIGILVDKLDDDSILKNKLKVGDIITKVDDMEMDSFEDFNSYIYTKNNKDLIKIEFFRDDKLNEINIILE